MVGEIYIVDSPKELGQLVRDVSRYEGTLSADDLYEIGQLFSGRSTSQAGNSLIGFALYSTKKGRLEIDWTSG